MAAPATNGESRGAGGSAPAGSPGRPAGAARRSRGGGERAPGALPRVLHGGRCSTRPLRGCSRGARDPGMHPVGVARGPVLHVYSRGCCTGTGAPVSTAGSAVLPRASHGCPCCRRCCTGARAPSVLPWALHGCRCCRGHDTAAGGLPVPDPTGTWISSPGSSPCRQQESAGQGLPPSFTKTSPFHISKYHQRN